MSAEMKQALEALLQHIHDQYSGTHAPVMKLADAVKSAWVADTLNERAGA